MSSTLGSLLLVTMAFSIVMLLVLFSLSRSQVDGPREWFRANLLAVGSLLLFGGRGTISDILSIEVANTTFMGAIAMMLVGFRRHFCRSVPIAPLAAGMALVLVVLVFFHYGVDNIGLRIVAVSIFHGAVCFAIGCTARRAIDPTRARYPYLFTTVAGFALGAGHLFRGLLYGAQEMTSARLFDPALWNLIFFSLGTLTFPLLTLGALMLAYAELLARSAYAADHDHLTGAWSRRAFFTAADREHARSLRAGTSLSFLLFDVDHFKRVNDTHGHAVGDEVLVDIVARTGRVIRSVDLCARLGGEEFAVLLPDADAATAHLVGARLREELECQVTIGASRAIVAYTVSIGVATMEAGESVADVLSRADAALYAAKAAGRNRVVPAPVPGLALGAVSPQN